MAIVNFNSVSGVSTISATSSVTVGTGLTITTGGVVGITSINNGPISGARNRIINGDMRIDQRNAGASVNGNAAFPVDRFSIGLTGSAVVSVARTTTNAPNNFTYSTSFTVSTADSSVTGSDYYSLYQRIEGNNVDDFKLGTANAKTFTLSFWVRSSVIGTYFVRFCNGAYDRSYVTSYSISTINTWEYKTITVAGDTSGTWLTNEGMGLVVEFCLGNGTTYQTSTTNSWIAGNYLSASSQTNWISTLSATFYITGVQLEVGPTATEFERRSFGQELALCQRYYFKTKVIGAGDDIGTGCSLTTTSAQIAIFFPVEMRTNVTSIEQTGTAGDYSVRYPGGAITCSGVPTYYSGTKTHGAVALSVSSGLTAGQGAFLRGQTANAYIAWSTEL